MTYCLEGSCSIQLSYRTIYGCKERRFWVNYLSGSCFIERFDGTYARSPATCRPARDLQVPAALRTIRRYLPALRWLVPDPAEGAPIFR